ncbi:DUF6443 domain-containing protein [Chryseolinea soli]|nr:DUF6443 domain-containing protein [Chryseolinea soli]
MARKIVFAFIVSLFLLDHTALAGNGLIAGLSSVEFGTTTDYEVNDDATYNNWRFDVDGGASIVSQTKIGFRYKVTVTFNTGSNQTIKFIANGGTVYDTFVVTVTGTSCPGVPTVSGGGNAVCIPGTVTLSASTTAGSIIRWIDNGSVVASGTSYQVLLTTAGQKTIQVQAYNTTYNCGSSLVNVSVTGNAAPSAPSNVYATPAAVCGSGQVTLSPSEPAGYYVWRDSNWQPISPTQTLTSTTTFSVEGYNPSTGCTGPSTQLTVPVDVPPSVYTVSGGGIYCDSGTPPLVTLNGSQANVKYELDKDNVPYGALVQGTGSALTWSNLPPGSYTVKAISEHNACSPLMNGSATLTANPASVGGTVSPAVFYYYSVATGSLSLSGHTGSVVQWEKMVGSGNWQVIANTAGLTTYNYSNLTAPVPTTITFRAKIQSGVCAAVYSATAAVRVYPLPTITYSGTIIPYGGTVTLAGGSGYAARSWQRNGVNIPGATGTSYTVTQPGKYSLTVQGVGLEWQTTGQLVITGVLATQTNAESTIIIRKSGVKPTTSIYSLKKNELSQTVTYSDGMGRPEQIIGVGTSPAVRDVIQYIEYSAYGLSEKRYLPYATSGISDGQKRATPTTEQYAFYHLGATLAVSDAPYAVSKLAASPLANLREQGAPGTDWQPGAHSVKTDLVMNTTNQVRYWQADGTTNSYYAANTLAVNQVTDENGNQVRAFTDKLGNVVLKQVQLDETVETRSTPWLETYYVYDAFGDLIYQLPPKAMALLGTGASLTAADAAITELIYQYTYDAAGRLIQKKVPNSAAQYIVYDTYDRPVLIQDGNLRATNEWFFVKYDSRDRVVMTGRYLDATHNTQATMQSYVTTTAPTMATYEEEGTTLKGYTNLSFPATNYDGTALTLHAVNYYDHYDFNRDGSADYTYTVQGLTEELPPALFVEGKPTGHTKLIEGTTTWLTSVVFYDGYGHVIQQRSNNHLSAAMDNLSTIVYDLEGKMKYTKTDHNAGGTNQLTVLGRYAYDNGGRLTGIYQTVPGATEQLVASYAYNELGQLVDKKLHSTAANVFLQSIDYRYNERGWLTSINNAQVNGTDTDATADYFGMELLYEKTATGLNDQAGDKTYWNGNISAIKWHNAGLPAGAADQRSYKYGYDKSDKLKTATFQANTGTAWTKEAGTLNEQMTYDANGNILTLQRNTVQRTFTGGKLTATPLSIDNLTYTYKNQSNALQKVEDATANTAGFTNGSNSTDEYTYTADGSLAGDLNKGIGTTGIVYNALGKPKTITYTDGRKLEYTYDLDGNKLTVKTYAAGSSTPASTVDYVGGFVYENGALSYFGSPEGRVVKKGATYEFQYAITDHQGNTRVLFSPVTPAPQVVTATFENATQTTEINNFPDSYPTGGNRSGLELYDHTDVSGSTYTYSQLLNGGNNSIVGLTRNLKVYPGDKVKVEAYAKYFNFNPQSNSSNIDAFATALTSAFGVSAASTGDALLAYNSLNSYGAVIAGGGGGGNTNFPKAFVTILLFDKNFQLIDAVADQIDGGEQVGATPKTAHDYMSKEYTVKEAGYAYIYISNETPTEVDVYFDDVTMTYTPTNILQVNEYYPYGLQTASSWTREGNVNNFLYNGGTEQNATTGLYDLRYRNFDPVLGRFHQVDPLTDPYASISPYSYANNDPVFSNDPNGLQTTCSWCAPAPVLPRNGIMDSQAYEAYVNSVFRPMIIDLAYGTLDLTTGQASSYHSTSSGDLESFARALRLLRSARDGDTDALGEIASMFGENINVMIAYDGVQETTTINTRSKRTAWFINDKLVGLYSAKRANLYGDFAIDGTKKWSLVFKSGFSGSDGDNGFWDHFENPRNKSNFITGSYATSAWGSVGTVAEWGLIVDSKISPGTFYTSATAMRAASANGARVMGKIVGPSLGFAGVLFTGYEAYFDDGHLSTGDWVKIGIGAAMVGASFTFLAPAVAVYGIVDLGVAIYTGTSITDRIAAGIDRN